MSDKMYFTRGTDVNGDATRYYSDTIYTEPVKGSSNPNALPIVFEYEFSEDYFIKTFDSTVHGIIRQIFKGKFSFNEEFEFVSGTINGGVSVKPSGQFSAINLSNPITGSPAELDLLMTVSRDPANFVVSTSMSEYSKFFPEGWANRPFEDNLISVGKTSSSSGSSSSSKGKTFNGTTKIDKIVGTSKDDMIIGGGAADRLTGGKGKDHFVYNTINDSRPGSRNRDTITDFNGREGDRIDLQKIDGNPKVSGNQKLKFIGSNVFTGKSGEVRFAGGVLQIDNNLDRKVDMEIALTGVTSFRQNFLIL